ncbi:site-specific integrase [Methylobacter tundripaludum]|uniref:site-specific integrase n=1 Tax=Methylobacter tundripaludum TaxID=173365 RepID=UPI0004871359|nr:site-specific integrase [Methylobacter tundripaludum]
MATIRQRSAGSWEIIIRRKGILPKPHYASAETEDEARAYAVGVERLLDQGILPVELQDSAPPAVPTVDVWARQYLVQVSISESDRLLLNAMLPKLTTFKTAQINIAWAQAWVSEMKQKDRLSPSSIRHKVGAVARLLDWCLRNEWLGANPLRMLSKRYASYTASDGDKKTDTERDRRLLSGEHEKIIWVLDGNFPKGVQRGITMNDRLAWHLLFTLAVETAMRLREMYTLSIDQVDLDKKTIFLDKTKNGSKRQVPLSSVALAALEAWKPKGDLIFPFWDGQHESLRKTTMKLSRKWTTIARLAGCDDLHFHDLRHEAVCRLYERTRMTDLQIAKISGHKDLRSLSRYANLRGSDLSEMLW